MAAITSTNKSQWVHRGPSLRVRKENKYVFSILNAQCVTLDFGVVEKKCMLHMYSPTYSSLKIRYKHKRHRRHIFRNNKTQTWMKLTIGLIKSLNRYWLFLGSQILVTQCWDLIRCLTRCMDWGLEVKVFSWILKKRIWKKLKSLQELSRFQRHESVDSSRHRRTGHQRHLVVEIYRYNLPGSSSLRFYITDLWTWLESVSSWWFFFFSPLQSFRLLSLLWQDGILQSGFHEQRINLRHRL